MPLAKSTYLHKPYNYIYKGLTLRANDHEFEDGSRFPESESREEMHPLVLSLLEEGMDPPVVTSHVPQGGEMTGHGRYHT